MAKESFAAISTMLWKLDIESTEACELMAACTCYIHTSQRFNTLQRDDMTFVTT